MSKLYVLVGLPGSGKSVYARKMLSESSNLVIHSSDSIRRELYGNESDQIDPDKVFERMKRRTKIDLQNGLDVIFDATNIKRQDRKGIIDLIRETNPGTEIIAVVLDTELSVCKANNKKRKRQVPEYVYERMMKEITMPELEEGFDQIIKVKQNQFDSGHNTHNNSDRNEIEFIGVFFDKEEFYTQVIKLVGDNRNSKKIEHPHVTVQYKPQKEYKDLYGKPVKCKVVGYANDQVNEGFLVKLETSDQAIAGLCKQIAVPHITISVSETGKAVNTRYLEFAPIDGYLMTGMFGGCTYRDELKLS